MHKIIADNFKDFSSTQTDVLLRGNPPLTLRERVKAAYTRKQDGEARALGHILYTTLRAEYSQVDAVAGRLMVKDSNEPVRAILKDALNALRSQPPGKGLIMAFFSDAEYINQREVVGLFKALLDMYPLNSQLAREVLVEAMRWVMAQSVNTLHPDECALLKKKFDETLVAVQTRTKKERVLTSVFWELHGDIAKLVCDTDPIKTLLELPVEALAWGGGCSRSLWPRS